MTEENIQQLQPHEIDRSGSGPVAGGDGNRQAVREQAPQPMSEAEVKGFNTLNDLRQQYSAATSQADKDVAWRKMDELGKHLAGQGKAPSWYSGEQNPKLLDNSPQDNLRDTLAERFNTPVDVEKSVSAGMMRGLDKGAAQDLSAVAHAAGLDGDTLKALQDVALNVQAESEGLPHQGDGYVRFSDLSQEEVQDLSHEIARVYPGGLERYAEHNEVIRQWLASKPAPGGRSVLDVVDETGLTDTVFAANPKVVSMLYFAAVRAGFGGGK